MKRITALLFLFAAILSGMAATPLRKRPLTFVPADSVIILPRTQGSIILDIMAFNPYLTPHPIRATKADRRLARHPQVLPDEKLFLYTAQAQCFNDIEKSYFNILPHALVDDGILPHEERIAAAGRLLDLTGTIVATDNKRDIYVNLFENCVTRVSTPSIRLVLDLISEYPEGEKVKIRIEGMNGEGLHRFTLHVRIPDWAETPTFLLNGRELIHPVIRDGYLVIDREWRNFEELFFLLRKA